jgi:hypothetical protein
MSSMTIVIHRSDEERRMGAKGAMLVYADTDVREALKASPPLDREATLRLANSLFASDKLISVADGILGWYTFPPEDEIHIGSFIGFPIGVATDFGIDYPSRLPERFLRLGASQTIYLHAMHSVVDWFAAELECGRLTGMPIGFRRQRIVRRC